jgi:light-regulated signal transduction histidine kinase (bacteriophytochrome)
MQTEEESKLLIYESHPLSSIGAIQPHGLLIAFDSKGTIGHVSANFGDFLQQSKPLPGWNMATYLGRQEMDELRTKTESADRSLRTTVSFRDGELRPHFHCHSYNLGDVTVCEFEPVTEETPEADIKLPSELDAIAGSIKEITGFDRVTVHKLDAESMSEDARVMLLKNRSRLIADVNATPSKLISIKRVPLDLTLSRLRAASADDWERLRNAQVAASFTISLETNQQLWGVIACHHQQPNVLPVHLRILCESLATTLSPKLGTGSATNSD